MVPRDVSAARALGTGLAFSCWADPGSAAAGSGSLTNWREQRLATRLAESPWAPRRYRTFVPPPPTHHGSHGGRPRHSTLAGVLSCNALAVRCACWSWVFPPRLDHAHRRGPIGVSASSRCIGAGPAGTARSAEWRRGSFRSSDLGSGPYKGELLLRKTWFACGAAAGIRAVALESGRGNFLFQLAIWRSRSLADRRRHPRWHF
jgi:hypothetical protein